MGAKKRRNEFSAESRELSEPNKVKKGPWTEEEDSKLRDYIAVHGEGRWSTVALRAGLKRTDKSCRLRWFNYLRPNLRHGNITLEEQLTILQLHSRLGNRWAKIAEQLPGRTDNEIKNFWRTRVQKQAKQLHCDVNSIEFRDAVHHLWLPRLTEQILASSEASTARPIDQSSDADDQVMETGLSPPTIGPALKPELSGTSSHSHSLEAQISPVSVLTFGDDQGTNRPKDLFDGLIYSPELVTDFSSIAQLSNTWSTGSMNVAAMEIMERSDAAS
ncbi:hypothetical protein RJ639_033610, partial [Escallonia herrerae]